MGIVDRLPKVADYPDMEFRFIRELTPALRDRADNMADTAFDVALHASECPCPPWIDCGHGDRQKAEKWMRRRQKLLAASDEGLMEVLSAPVGGHWIVVDALVMGDDGVARP